MRKIVVYNVISLDGYHTGSGNDVSVMFPMMGKVFDSYNAELLRTADLHLMGRVSFELFQSFWPKVAENPTSEEWTDSQRDLSHAGKSVKGIVVSDTLEGNWQDVHIIRRRDAHQQLAELKRQEGKDILITGSRTLWNDLLAHVKRTISELKEGMRRPCCWLGCIHRKDKPISPSVQYVLDRRSKRTK